MALPKQPIETAAAAPADDGQSRPGTARVTPQGGFAVTAEKLPWIALMTAYRTARATD
ncbi:MAG: hypothetical protein K2X72_18510 [Reyranella sp.]|nr:hypothetical protein [Reyranella sp.]